MFFMKLFDRICYDPETRFGFKLILLAKIYELRTFAPYFTGYVVEHFPDGA